MASRYWVGGSATWDNTAGTKWSTVSGGGGGASVPGSGDDVFFDAASGAVTVTLGAEGYSKSFTTTGFTGTLDGSASLWGVRLHGGNLTIGASTTLVNSYFSFRSGTTTITSNGKDLERIEVFAATVIVGDDLLTSHFSYLVSATSVLTAVATNVNTGSLDTTNGSTLNMGSGTWTVTAGNTPYTGFWIVRSGTVVNAGTSTLKFVVPSTSNGISLFDHSPASSYNNLWVTGDYVTALANRGFSFSSNGSFADFKVDVSTFPINTTSGKTITFTSFTQSGSSSGSMLKVQRYTGGGSFYTWSCASTVSGNYLNLEHCHAAGGGTFTAYDSTDGGDNTGWIFASGANVNSLFFGSTF